MQSTMLWPTASTALLTAELLPSVRGWSGWKVPVLSQVCLWTLIFPIAQESWGSAAKETTEHITGPETKR